jgi:peptidoglycan biosynthesis protein MviN/MurJ (putative lipid II flippase)
MKLKKVGGFSLGTFLSRITGMGREVALGLLSIYQIFLEIFLAKVV